MKDTDMVKVNGVTLNLGEYKAFLYNPENIGKCKTCLLNEGFDGGCNSNRHPCGQYRCWIAVHCE